MPAKTNDFPADLARFHRKLREWYALHGRRDLPWRNTRDGYRIYISEIMLQQTQVKTVLERYYRPFLKRFPTLKALAAATTEEVVKEWEGLGYYTRARNLHAAAQRSGDALPDTVEGLLALPGIGRNTAHAVACFGFGLAVPVMEANVKRVLCRVFALEFPNERTLWDKAEWLLDRKNPFDYNQAMMDIGAMVCTKRLPRCGECPLAQLCSGKHAPEKYPQTKRKKVTPIRKQTIVAFAGTDGRYFLQPRTTRFLGGLYGFMEYEEEARKVDFLGKTYTLDRKALLGAVTQVYSHFTLEAKVCIMQAKGGQALPQGMVSASLEDMARLPLSRADRKIAQMLAERESLCPPAC